MLLLRIDGVLRLTLGVPFLIMGMGVMIFDGWTRSMGLWFIGGTLCIMSGILPLLPPRRVRHLIALAIGLVGLVLLWASLHHLWSALHFRSGDHLVHPIAWPFILLVKFALVVMALLLAAGSTMWLITLPLTLMADWGGGSADARPSPPAG